MQAHKCTQLAVAFLASDVNRFSIMERLTKISPKVCIHSHTFMPLPGTPMQFMPPGSVGRMTRTIFEKLSRRGQEWGDWEKQEEIAHVIADFRNKTHKI